MAAMVNTVNHPTVTTSPTLSPTCSLELDFPWLISSSTPTLQPQALPTGAAQQSLDNVWDFTNSWSPVRGMMATGSFDVNTTASTPSSAYSSPGGSPAASPGSQLTQASSGYHSLPHSPSSGSETSTPPPQPLAVTSSAGKPVTKHTKPNATYIEMIARALLSAPGQKMILQDMYAYIQQHYPYYQNAQGTWKNSVRHNLCVNECFMKAGRSNSSRGFFWSIHPACMDMFSRGDFGRMKAKKLAQKMYKSIRAAAEASSASTSKPPSPPAAYSTAAHQVLPSGSLGAYSAVNTAVPTSYVYAPSASMYTPRTPMVSSSNSGHLQQQQQLTPASFSDYRMALSSMANSSSRVPVNAPHYYHPYGGYYSSQSGHPTSVYPSSCTTYPSAMPTAAATTTPTYDHSTTYNSYYSQGTGAAPSTYQMTVPRFL